MPFLCITVSIQVLNELQKILPVEIDLMAFQSQFALKNELPAMLKVIFIGSFTI